MWADCVAFLSIFTKPFNSLYQFTKKISAFSIITQYSFANSPLNKINRSKTEKKFHLKIDLYQKLLHTKDWHLLT